MAEMKRGVGLLYKFGLGVKNGRYSRLQRNDKNELQDFKSILSQIEESITPHQVNGGNEVISAPERLVLTLRFLAKGESFKSLSFQFRISNRTISYIVQQV